MRAYRSATITFGLVSVPVNLAPLFKEDRVSGKFVCEKHLQPVSQTFTCSCKGCTAGKATGYELPDGSYVVLTADQLLDIQAVKSKAVELEGFVPMDEIDPIYFDKHYVLWPKAKEADQSYGLLAALLCGMDVAGVGTITLEKSSVPVAVRHSKVAGRLVMHLLKYPAEYRASDIADLDPVLDKLDEKYITAGRGLITSAMIPFDLSGHVDTYQEGLRTILANASTPAKKGSKKVVPVPSDVTPDKLMDALKATVASMKEEK